MVPNNLQDARTAKSLEGFGRGVFSAALRDIERVTYRILYILRKRCEVGPATPNPNNLA